MKKLLGSLALFLSLATVSPAFVPLSAATAKANTTETAVYVCVSKSSVAFHSTDECSGLNRCTHEIKAMSTADAQRMGKRACLKCY